MVFKFPSGMVSVRLGDLRDNPQSQSTCSVCDKPWIVRSYGCVGDQIHVLHPCQHIIGAGCWSSLPNQHRDKCPLCKVEIEYQELIGIQNELARRSQASGVSIPGFRETVIGSQAEETAEEKKMREGLNDVDVRAIMYYMNLRARLDTTKGSLGTLLASTQTLTPAHRDRLVLFLVNSPQNLHDSAHRKIEVALSAFNISGGTNFTMNDLRKILFSAEDWVKQHFAAILDESEAANADASSLRQMENKLAKIETDIRDLKDRQSRENAQRLQGNIKLACQEIGKKADEEAAKILAKARAEAAKVLAKAKEDNAKLHSHGKVMRM